MNITAIPVDQNGVALGEDDFLEDPYSLIGKSISFKLKVVGARGLPTKYKKTNCRYDNSKGSGDYQLNTRKPAAGTIIPRGQGTTN